MIKVNRESIILISGLALILSGCGDDSKTANEANFKVALNAHFAKMKECSGIGGKTDANGYIKTFRVKGHEWTAQEKERFIELEKRGVLEVVKFQKEETSFTTDTEMVDYVGYKFSVMGKGYLRPTELDTGTVNSGIPQLCYGTKSVLEVTNFTEPADVAGVKASNVKFKYKLVDIAPWADSPAVNAKAINASEDSEDMILTNDGWMHHSVVK